MKTRCLIVDDEPVAIRIIAAHLQQLPNIEIVGECQNALAAMQVLHQQKVDLMFLDIQMPQITGLDFLKSLSQRPQVIITTAHREYAPEGFELEVLDYLLKPIAFERFLKAIHRYYEQQNPAPYQSHLSLKESANQSLFVRADRKMVKLDLDKLLYIEALKDYVKLVSRHDTILTKESLSDLLAKLPETDFIQIHRSYVVALRHISAYTHEYIEVDERSLPIGRVYKQSILQILKA